MRFLLCNTHPLVDSPPRKWFSESQLVSILLKDFPFGELDGRITHLNLDEPFGCLIEVHACVKHFSAGIEVCYHTPQSKILALGLIAGLASLQLPVPVQLCRRSWFSSCHAGLRMAQEHPHVSVDLCGKHDERTIAWLHNPQALAAIRVGLFTGMQWYQDREEQLHVA